jgi:hypothetical protein
MSNWPNSVVDSWHPNSRIGFGIPILKKIHEWELELKIYKKLTVPIRFKWRDFENEFFYSNKNLLFKILYSWVPARTVYMNLVAKQKRPKITQLILGVLFSPEKCKNKILNWIEIVIDSFFEKLVRIRIGIAIFYLFG